MPAAARVLHPASTGESDPPTGATTSRFRRASGIGFPLAAYALSRALVFVAATFVGGFRATPDAQPFALSVALSWDGRWNRAIVAHGYPSAIPTSGGRAVQSVLAFFPLYPFSARAVDFVMPFGRDGSLVLVATVFGAVATCLIWWITRDLFDRETADRAALLFCLAPGAFVLSFAYSESMMISLSLVCLWALTRRHWMLAGIVGALATLTRPNALALVVCAAWAAACAIRERREWRALAAPLLVPIGFVGFVGFLGVHTGHASAWFRVEREGWEDRFDAGWGVVNDFYHYVSGGAHTVDTTIIFVSTLTVVVGLVLLLRAHLPSVYVVFTFAVLAFALTSANLSARPRFVLTAFPLAIAAARLLRREVFWVVLACSAGGMVLLVAWYGSSVAGNIPP